MRNSRSAGLFGVLTLSTVFVLTACGGGSELSLGTAGEQTLENSAGENVTLEITPTAVEQNDALIEQIEFDDVAPAHLWTITYTVQVAEGELTEQDALINSDMWTGDGETYRGVELMGRGDLPGCERLDHAALAGEKQATGCDVIVTEGDDDALETISYRNTVTWSVAEG